MPYSASLTTVGTNSVATTSYRQVGLQCGSTVMESAIPSFFQSELSRKPPPTET